MAHYVQVVNDLVVNMWDSPPRVPIGEDGWRNAVVNLPTINDQKQYLGNWTYDLTQDPVAISREVINFTIEERKNNLLTSNELKFNAFMEAAAKNPMFYDKNDFINNKNIAAANKDAINSATTHEDLDQLNLTPIELF